LCLLTLVVSCAIHHPLSADWEHLSTAEREAEAIETVRAALAERGGKIPGRPGVVENDVLFVDRRLAVFRPCCKQPGNLAVLLFRDVTGLERRVVYDFPSEPEDLSVHLRRQSPSVWGVQAEESLLSPVLSRVGLGDAVLLLPRRPRDTYRRLEAALEYLLSLPRRREGPGPVIEEILRRSAEQKRDRSGFEAKVLAALGEHRAETSWSAGESDR
jgi:hypothetical protein